MRLRGTPAEVKPVRLQLGASLDFAWGVHDGELDPTAILSCAHTSMWHIKMLRKVGVGALSELGELGNIFSCIASCLSFLSGPWHDLSSRPLGLNHNLSFFFPPIFFFLTEKLLTSSKPKMGQIF